jgi:hypothetical protein
MSIGLGKFKDLENQFDKAHRELWDINYEQRQFLQNLGNKITFRLLLGLYYMVNKLEYETDSDKFNYATFMKFMDRQPDAPYEKYMGNLSDPGGISLFLKACIATEGQPGYAPIAYKLLVEDGYRDTVETISRRSIDLSNRLGSIEGVLDMSKDFLGVTSIDIAKLHRVMCPIYKHDYATTEAFLKEYNNIGVENGTKH